MTNPAQIGLRGTRAAVLGTATLLLAAAAHAAGGGGLPSIPVLLAVGVPTACASVVLARRARRLPSLLAFLAVGQVVIHEAFATAAGPTCANGTVTIDHAGHVMAVPCGGAAAMPMQHGSGGALMVLAHAFAVAAVALLLAHGERTAVRLWTWLRPRVVIPAAPLPVPTPVGTTIRVPQLVPQVRAGTDVSRRGPPARTAHVPVIA